MMRLLHWLLPCLMLMLWACGDDAEGVSDVSTSESGASDDASRTGGIAPSESGIATSDADVSPVSAVSSPVSTTAPTPDPSTSPEPSAESSTTPEPTPAPPGLCEGHPWEAGEGGSPPSLDAFPAGPHAVSWRDFERVPLHDDYRYRVRVFVPSGTEAPVPGLIFVHGFQLDGEDFYWYGEALASYGYFVVIPTVGDGLGNPRRHSDLGDDVVELVSWMVDQAAESGSVFHERLDTDRIAAGGHSRGGKSAILGAIRDERIRASFNLDPVDANPPFPFANRGYTIIPDEMADFTIPGAFVGTGKGGRGITPCAPTDTNYEQYFGASAGPSYLFNIGNAGHNDFAQRCLDASGLIRPTACSACQDGDHPRWNVDLAVVLSAAFHAVHLRNDDSCRDWLTGTSMESLAPWVTVSTRNLRE